MYTSVTNTSVSDNGKNWVEIETENGKLILTEDHEVYTQRGWVEAKDLTEKDDIFSIKD
jgi:intein/homing endonuclease